MVIEAGVVAGYVIAWALRKARRVAGRADAVVDAAVDAGLDKLEAAVVAKLRGHPALDDLVEEASGPQGQVSELTRRQVELALTAAARKDEVFGQMVTDLVAQVRTAEQTAGVSVVAGADARVFMGDAHVQVRGNGVGFGQIGGDVHLNQNDAGGRRMDPPGPGPERH